GGTVVLDAGTEPAPAVGAAIEVADAALMVIRPCYLALRRAVADPRLERSSGAVLVEEPGRALDAADVAAGLGGPVVGRFPGRAGRLEPVPVELDESEVRRMVERIIAPLGLRLDRSSPMVDARLPDGSRLHAVLAPVAVDGTCVAIRRFGRGGRQLADFDLPSPSAALLRWAVRAGWHLLLSGGTGAGTTTLLHALAGAIPPGAR